ncbi:MAG: trigger factor [Gemmatimonadetes bacterium]|nr:trigger factor [Gemmatimonadota bacterium]
MADIIDAPAVRTRLEELPRWRRRIEVEVPARRAEVVRRRYLEAFTRKARLKGFRPGKAPAKLVEQKYGGEIEQETLKDLIHEGYEAAVEHHELDPVGMPDVRGVRWTDEGDLAFTAEVDVEPEIELARTGGFRVEKKVRTISDEDVDRVLERLREDRADWRPVDRPAAEGDRIVFDSVPLDAGGEPREAERVENHRIEVGEGSLLPDFEEGLRGRKPGERAEIVVRFPEDHPNEALRSAARTFRISVDAVKEKVLPGLDDEFARSVGAFDSLEDLRAHVRKNLEEEVDQQSRREVNEALIDQIIEANDIEVPEAMVDRYLANMMSDRGGPLEGRVPEERMEEMRKVLRPGAERAIRRYYILQRFADERGLRADDEAVHEAIAERIDTEETSVAEARRRLERSGDLEDLRFHLTMERVFESLREESEIVETEADD